MSPAGSGWPPISLAAMTDVYAQAGGAAFFEQLVDRFYDGVEGDPVLRPLYPEQDLAPARRRLRMFLEQYWGGPTTYSDERGHPRLRMRHATWSIGARERDAWLTHMGAALASLELPAPARAAVWEHLERAAHSLVNADG